ncbi:sensor histidine kinase [Aldersonia kunmingensis]|uniref:sensor histidine kinase n=1 Tax=Aldersonia kunmingensis TaxID=408066 RepID=UPI000A3F20B7|nr:histidine kinase [Aldersonia kunmingensis]
MGKKPKRPRPIRSRLSRISASQWFDAFVVLSTFVLFVVAWSTLHITHVVKPALMPVQAAIAAFPLLLIRANPATGWACSVLAALAFAIIVDHQPGNSLPWQVVQIIVIIALLIAVCLTLDPMRVAIAWLVTVTLFVTFMPSGARVSWVVALSAVVAFAVLLRRLANSRTALARQEEQSELERAKRAVLEEKARIARDLHDIVAHHMSLVVVQAQTAQYRLDDVSPSARAEFDAIAVAAREALNEIRGLLGVLRSTEQPLAAAPQPGLSDVVGLLDATRRAGIAVEWTRTGTTSAVSDATGLALYRILQEALSNAARHAPGSPVRVELVCDGGMVALTVANGPGIGEPPPGGPGGLGIVGMAERARSIGGSLVAAPFGAGFEVRVQLPMRPADQLLGLA